MSRMEIHRRIVRATLALALASGCSTIYNARMAQDALAPMGDDGAEAAAAEQVDFRGASLAALVDYALTNRPSVVSKALAVHDARLALKALAADAPVLSETPWTAPQISLSAGHSEASDGFKMNGGDWSTRGDPSAAISLELLIYDLSLIHI